MMGDWRALAGFRDRRIYRWSGSDAFHFNGGVIGTLFLALQDADQQPPFSARKMSSVAGPSFSARKISSVAGVFIFRTENALSRLEETLPRPLPANVREIPHFPATIEKALQTIPMPAVEKY